MSSKVLFIKYVPHLLRGGKVEQQKAMLAAAECVNSHVIVLKCKRGCLSIEGFPDIPSHEKHKAWSLFQNTVKQLLGVSPHTSICLRFSYPPCSFVSSLSEILHEPSHLVHLIATPLPQTNSLITQGNLPRLQPCSHIQQGDKLRDPYSCYRDMFHKGTARKTPTLNKPKYNFADMDRLLSQLEEVSQSLERTKLACERLRASSPNKKSTTPLCDKSPLTPRDSENCSSLHEEEVDGQVLVQSAEDEKIENLLELAESVIRRPPPLKTEPTDLSPTDEMGVSLPDPPTDIAVQPSVTEGGVYIMWNPVRLDAKDMNHNHTVLGYMVYLDKRLRVRVDGALSSQAELLKDLEDGHEYHVQVCTHTNHCNSLLSTAVKYRHCTKTSRQAQLTKIQIQQQKETKSKTARVKSWLLDAHVSQSQARTLASGVRGSVSEQNSAPSCHHVHFAQGNLDEQCFSHWTGSNGDMTTQLLDSGCEDTRSNASSRTSGIVTDFPASPFVKQTQPFTSYNFLDTLPDAHSISTQHSNAHSDDGFHTLTHCSCLEEGGKLTIGSILSPSNRTSREGSTEYSCSTDTVIDEPLMTTPATRSIDEVDGQGSTRGRLLRMTEKRPEAPEGLSINHDSREKCLVLKWTPVRRDPKGYNNGFFILGYRIYINDVVHSSVNGSMSCQTKIAYPAGQSNQPIKLDIRSRAMAGESLPSTPVHIDPISRQQAITVHRTSSCMPRCTSTASTAQSDHTIHSRNLRVETCV